MAFNFFMHSSSVMIQFTGHTFGQISVHLTHIREIQQPSPHTTRTTPLPCCNIQQRALPQVMMHTPPNPPLWFPTLFVPVPMPLGLL